MVLKRLSVSLGKTLHIYCSGVLGDRAQVNEVLPRRSSWKGHLSMTVGKKLCMFIAQVSQETELQVDMIVLLWEMILKRPLINDTGKECSAHSLFKSFGRQSFKPIWTFYLKRLLIGDTLEESALHVHFSGLLGDRAFWLGRLILGRYSWNGRPITSDTVGRD